MVEESAHCLVLDIGKTNVKIHLLDKRQRSVAVEQRSNVVLGDGPYPHADVSGTWEWMLEVFSGLASRFDIDAIAVSTHGATAALVDPARGGDGLVLPVLDYEWTGVEADNGYDAVRPAFSETFSPKLPAGLNLGRQLFWQQQAFSEAFAEAKAILMYPQYWAWRMTGALVSEITSLGCHTDLWAPREGTWSGLVAQQGWQDRLPPLVPAWEPIGTITPELARRTDLPAHCRVHAGIHDSNASYLRLLLSMREPDFCVVSSGTWVICMSSGSPLDRLDETRDMLANVDVRGGLVPCIRFMGGREYAEICERFDADPGDTAEEADLEIIISNEVFALPDYSGGSGPFGGRTPGILGHPHNGSALATLYCALMVDYCLDRLQVERDIIIVGSYLQNPLLCSLIAQLRGMQRVYLSSDTAGTVRGAAQLTDWTRPVALRLNRCAPSRVANLDTYARKWRELSEMRT